MAGFLFHTIRFTAEEGWQEWGDVAGAAGDIGEVTAVACARLGRDLHVLARGSTRLQHTIRGTDERNWRGFVDVEASAGDLGGVLHAVAAAQVGNDLHVVGSCFTGTARESRVVHTILSPEGHWQPFGDVTRSRAGNPSDKSHYGRLACAEIEGDLHMIVQGRARDGDGVLFHTIRRTDKLEWQEFGNVNEAASASVRSFPRSVSCARMGVDLHVTAPDQNGILWHTVRRSRQETWSAIEDVCEAAQRPGIQFERAASADVGNELHVVGLTRQGELLHTIRFSDGHWQRFGELSRVLGTFPRAKSHVADIGCAGVSGDLHACFGSTSERD